MNKSPGIAQLQWRLALSGLWLYFLLNLLFRDIHEFFREGFLDQALTGVVQGSVVTETNLFYGGIALQVPLLTMLLSRLLVDSANRWLNLVVSTAMFAGVVVFNSTPDLDDLLFAVMEGIALISVFGLAWRGPEKVVSRGPARG